MITTMGGAVLRAQEGVDQRITNLLVSYSPKKLGFF